MANRDYDSDDRDYEGTVDSGRRWYGSPYRHRAWPEEAYSRGARHGTRLQTRGRRDPSYDPYDYRGLAGQYLPLGGGLRGWWRAERFGEYGPQRRSFAGRGPKTYRRSDARIEEDVNDLLTYSPDLDASDIEVRVDDGIVTLSGIVEDRGDKRLAEDLAENVFGVQDVNNELEVRHGLWARVTGEHVQEREIPRARETATRQGTRGTARPATRSSRVGAR